MDVFRGLVCDSNVESEDEKLFHRMVCYQLIFEKNLGQKSLLQQYQKEIDREVKLPT